MKSQRLNERKFFIFGFLFGVFISGLITLVYSVTLISRQSNFVSIAKDPNLNTVENNLVYCSTINSDPSNVKININTASTEELDSLPGIGEVKASSIIEFRQKYGNFKTIEEILYVSGISETTFQQICSLISVNRP